MKNYGDEYAPELFLSAEQIAELRRLGCNDAAVATIGYFVGRQREETITNMPAKEIHRSADKILRHAEALSEELKRAPREVRATIRNAIWFRKNDPDEPDTPHEIPYLENIIRGLGAVSEVAYEITQRDNADGRRPTGGKVITSGRFVDRFTLSLLRCLADDGLQLTNRHNIEEIIRLAWRAAELAPPSDMSRIVGPALAIISKK